MRQCTHSIQLNVIAVSAVSLASTVGSNLLSACRSVGKGGAAVRLSARARGRVSETGRTVTLPLRDPAPSCAGPLMAARWRAAPGISRDLKSSFARRGPRPTPPRSRSLAASGERRALRVAHTAGEAGRVLQGVSPWSTGYGRQIASAICRTYLSCLARAPITPNRAKQRRDSAR